MTDKDLKMKNDSDDSIDKVDSSVEPELLGVELSEELKKADPGYVEEVSAGKDVVPSIPVVGEIIPKIDAKEFDLEIDSSQDSLPPVPKKEFSMPEQSKQIEEIVDTYVPGSSLANS